MLSKMLHTMTQQGRWVLQQTWALKQSVHRYSSLRSGNQTNLRKVRNQIHCLYLRTSSTVNGSDSDKSNGNDDWEESDEFLASRSDMPTEFKEMLKPSENAKNRITEPVPSAQYQELASTKQYQEFSVSPTARRDNNDRYMYEEKSTNRHGRPNSSNSLKRSRFNKPREIYSEPERGSVPLDYVRNKEKLVKDIDQYSSIDYMEPRLSRSHQHASHGTMESNHKYMEPYDVGREHEEFSQSGKKVLGHKLKYNQNDSGLNTEKRKNRFDGRVTPDRYNFGLDGEGRHSKDKYERLSKKQSQPSLQGEALFGKFPCLIALQEKRRHFYGLYCLRSWLESADPIHREILATAEAQGLRVEACERSRLDIMSRSRPNQGVCLDASKLRHEELDDSVFDGESQLCLLLDSIKDPMNLGSILRAAYYLGVDKILSVTTNSVPLNPVVSKASTGVMEVLPVYGVPTAEETVQLFRERGWHILGTVGSVAERPDLADKTVPVSEAGIDSNILLVIGSEGRGITPEVLSQCDQLVTIAPGRPLHPHMDSLNVSVATGIILQHIMAKKALKTRER